MSTLERQWMYVPKWVFMNSNAHLHVAQFTPSLLSPSPSIAMKIPDLISKSLLLQTPLTYRVFSILGLYIHQSNIMQYRSIFFCQQQLELLLARSPQGIHNWKARVMHANIGYKRQIFMPKAGWKCLCQYSKWFHLYLNEGNFLGFHFCSLHKYIWSAAVRHIMRFRYDGPVPNC